MRQLWHRQQQEGTKRKRLLNKKLKIKLIIQLKISFLKAKLIKDELANIFLVSSTWNMSDSRF